MKVKPAYWLWPLALWMILWMPKAQAGTWGSVADTASDSIEATSLYYDGPGPDSLDNFGTLTLLSNRWSGSVSHRTHLIRMKNDKHTAGYTQDSAKLIYTYQTLPGNDDSIMFYWYVLRRDWGEGTHADAPATSGEACWTYAQYNTVAWGTRGAKNTSTDRQSTVACSLLVDSAFWYSRVSGGTVRCTLRIAGTHLTQDFFDYGLVCDIGWVQHLDPANFAFASDDHGTLTKRPYFLGWESPTAATALKIGTVQLGTTKIGP